MTLFPVTVPGWLALLALVALAAALVQWATKRTSEAALLVLGSLFVLLASFPLIQIARGKPPLPPAPAWLLERFPQSMWGWIALIAALLAASALLMFAAYRVFVRIPEVLAPPVGGIGLQAGQPKVYDNRSLTLMIEELKAQLDKLSAIKDTVTANLGTQQGKQTTNVSLAVAPTTETPAPAPAPAATDAKPEPTFTERAGDLLEDQVNLSFQIFNLQLTLERALSDRRLNPGQTKLQGVIGIPISISPPPYAAGCAGRVEIRLKALDVAIERKPSLVALFPQEQTSNFLGVSSRAVDASGSFSLGSNKESTRLQASQNTASLIRQADVVAYEIASGNNEELALVWEFRPKLGERTVTPGLKQVMAVISLPVADTPGAEPQIVATARCSWHRWNAASRTAGAGLGWRGFLSGKPQALPQGPFDPVTVPSSSALEQELAPMIESIDWTPMGDGKAAALVVTGHNFFPGTSVVVGGTLRSKPEDGFHLQSQHSFEVLAPMEDLRFGAVLNGRYGPPRRLEVPLKTEIRPPVMQSIVVSPDREKKMTRIEITLMTEEPWPLSFVKKLGDPVLLVNGKLVPSPLDLEFFPGATPPKIGSLIARAVTPFDFLPSKTLVFELKWPFYAEWTATGHSYDPTLQVWVYRSSVDALTARLTFRTEGVYDQPLSVILDQVYSVATNNLRVLAPGPNGIAELDILEDILAGFRECFVTQPGQLPIALKIPPRQGKPFSLTPGSPPQVQAAVGGMVKYTGTGLDLIKEVTVGATSVTPQPLKDGTAILLFLKKEDIPKTAGLVQVTFKAGSASETADLLVIDTAVTPVL